MAWFPKEVDLTWIHISFVYANIYLSFYFEGPHSNLRYILVALKKDGNNVHFFDVLPHCAAYPPKNIAGYRTVGHNIKKVNIIPVLF